MLGRDRFMQAVANPDRLAAFEQMRTPSGRERRDWNENAWLAWASLNYVATQAFEAAHGEHEDFYVRYEQTAAGQERPAVLTDERWDFDDSGQAAVRPGHGRECTRGQVDHPVDRQNRICAEGMYSADLGMAGAVGCLVRDTVSPSRESADLWRMMSR